MHLLKGFLANFTPLPKESFDLFFKLTSVVKFKKGDVITKSGEVSKSFYIIIAGIVRSYHEGKKGKQYIRTIFTPQNTTGSLGSLISEKPGIFTYDCLSNCELYKFNYKKFKNLTKNNHHLAILYYELLEHVFLILESKIYDLSILNATERYLKLKREIPGIENMIPQYHIASYLNITAVQLSRIRKEIYSK